MTFATVRQQPRLAGGVTVSLCTGVVFILDLVSVVVCQQVRSELRKPTGQYCNLDDYTMTGDLSISSHSNTVNLPLSLSSLNITYWLRTAHSREAHQGSDDANIHSWSFVLRIMNSCHVIVNE